jgi:hypothetical protein
MKLAICIALAAVPALAQPPDIHEIMSRVAANQAKSVEARKYYVYRQNERISLHKANGKLACQETQEYTVTPGPNGVVKRRTKAEAKGDGTCSVNSGSSNEAGGTETRHSGDGIPHDLFPLTADRQRLYSFQVENLEKYRGRDAYRVHFQPNHQRDQDGDEGYWKGEALVDAKEFQLAQVTTDLTAKIPLAVRILLGTNVHGVGFTVSYERMPDGVWFPASFGGEFEVRALFFIRRTVVIDVRNSDFRRTDVVSTLAFDNGKQ